jgi:RNA polymerase sigma-70 factor (ECF subfamily)
MEDNSSAGFAAWYEAEHPGLVTALLLVTGDGDIAREAADEAFARAWLHWPRVAVMGSPRGWTYRVALNVVRRRGRRLALERALLARRLSPCESAMPPPAGEAWEVVRELPRRERTAVVLRFIADLTEEQAAAVMGVSRTTVSRALAHALRTLGRRLAEDDTDLEVGYA